MVVDELLRSKQILFKPSGRDLVVSCLSPEHDDSNPSMRIDSTTGIFKCMSCGFSGNIFNHFNEHPDWLQIRRQKLKDVIDVKMKETVGLSIPENAVPFNQDWRGISAATYLKFQAFQHNNPEFIGRVVFPIRNISDKIVAFTGRHQGQEIPKYLVHPHKAKIPLFPIVKAIKGSIIIVEGIFDMLNLHDKGLTNAVCAFGVTTFDKEKINILKIQGVRQVYIFFDNDEAGQKGASSLKEKLEEADIACNIITMDGIKDPGELTALNVLKLKEKLYSD